MSKNASDKAANQLSGEATVALIVFGLLSIAPTLGFFSFGQDLFGDNAFAKLLLISGIGGALASSIWCKGALQRLVAIFPGIVMGVGVPITLMSYVEYFNRTSLIKIEIVLVSMIGIFPGLLLRLLIDRLVFKRKEPGEA